ncbi:MAG: HD domain-containing phosphohydrolase [Chloroflexota bacterium]
MNRPHARRRPPLAALAWLAVLLALLTGYSAMTLKPFGSEALQDFSGRWVYDAIVLGAAAAVLLRGIRMTAERAAWLSLGAGLLLWALGQTYYSIVLYYAYPAPFPSPADVLFLAFYPAVFLGLVFLMRSRSNRDSFAWIDSLIGALAVAAVAAALVFPPVLEALGGSALGVAVSLAYPCADLVLVGLVAAALTGGSWRGQGIWLAIAAAFVLFGVADVVYLSVGGQSTEALDLASIGWPAAFVIFAAVAWTPASAAEPEREGPRSSIAPPIVLAGAVIALLALASFHSVGAVAVGLGVASLLAVLVRLAATFRANTRMIAASHEEAVTDLLTGLANRRSLIDDLERALAAGGGAGTVFALYDLNGFKAYNDSFGHTAGDDLLQRLGASLSEAVSPWGRAYRLGGDEFCVLASTESVKADAIVAAAKASLSDSGTGFSITASSGMVRLPDEAATPTEALRLADRRMYMEKGQRADSALSQARSVLLGLLRERQPDHDRHVDGVARLAYETGHALGLDSEDLDVLVRAAEMHDIGKVAIPDEILRKPGPLDEAELELMRKHTEIGERVLYSAPALREVGKVVRSTHERWDGSGYPDGLAGEEIPLAARVILICNAYDSMVESRLYGEPLSEAEAIGELRRGAGGQFDPELVEIVVTRVLGVGDSGDREPAAQAGDRADGGP